MNQNTVIPSFDTVKQFSKDEIDILNSKTWWADRTAQDIALIQAHQRVLICDFAVFKKSVETVLGELLTDSAFIEADKLQASLHDSVSGEVTVSHIESLLIA